MKHERITLHEQQCRLPTLSDRTQVIGNQSCFSKFTVQSPAHALMRNR